MDLEVVGRHALLFDDDAMAAFVNSGEALVEWHSLQIDRYDVRHLLSAPPPPRRRNRTAGPVLLEDLSLESQLDHERYLDLPSQEDQSDGEKDKHQVDASGFHAVAFSYGSTDDSIDPKNTDAGMESSGFVPHFSIPGHLLHSLPPTEKLHQIIARTAMFVNKHGGQSEIILRVKQGDNPTFGFLMPDHPLHPYFRYLVEHPELLNPESDGNPQDDGKEAGNDHGISNDIGGALSLLGSVYGSGEEEDGQDSEKTAKDVLQGSNSSATDSNSKKIQSRRDSVPRNLILSNKEKVITAKRGSSVPASKPGTVKGAEKEIRLVSADADKAKKSAVGVTSNIDSVIPEPPPELKRMIDKIVEFIKRNGKQFEATLIEQDSKHGRFPFLLPSDKYHSYYLKVLETAQESKENGKGMYSGKDDLLGRKKASVHKEKETAYCDLPLESDKKEKFKMVIGKSKKEMQETESKGTQLEPGFTVDAAAAAAILQAATRGIKQTGLQLTSSNSSSTLGHANSSGDGHPRNVGNLLPSRTDNAVSKSEQSESRNGSDIIPKILGRAVSIEVANEADSGEAHLTKEQKLKAERLKRAKMFVAMLKKGEVPVKTETSRGSSSEPPEPVLSRSASKADIDGKERESSLAPANVDTPVDSEKLEKNEFGEEHTQRLSKRKYRSRSGHEEDDDDTKDHDERHRKRDCRSRSRHHDKYPNDSSDDDSGQERDCKHYKLKHRSEQEDESNDKHKKDKNHKRSRKKRHCDSSPRKHSRKRHSSKQHVEEEDEHDEREGKHSRKRHHSHRSSHHSRDKQGHRSEHSFRDRDRDRESQSNLKHGTSSDDENHQNRSGMDKHRKESNNERNDLEEGELSSRVSEESRGIAVAHIDREASVDGVSSHQRASSQPSETTTTEVPDDLRAKIRAMLMATRL